MFAGGEGAFLMQVEGEGPMVISAFGAIDRFRLEAGHRVVVDSDHFVAAEMTRAVHGSARCRSRVDPVGEVGRGARLRVRRAGRGDDPDPEPAQPHHLPRRQRTGRPELVGSVAGVADASARHSRSRLPASRRRREPGGPSRHDGGDCSVGRNGRAPGLGAAPPPPRRRRTTPRRRLRSRRSGPRARRGSRAPLARSWESTPARRC